MDTGVDGQCCGQAMCTIEGKSFLRSAQLLLDTDFTCLGPGAADSTVTGKQHYIIQNCKSPPVLYVDYVANYW